MKKYLSLRILGFKLELDMRFVLAFLLVASSARISGAQSLTDCWTSFNTSNSTIPSNVVQCVDIGSSDTAWVGTINGLAKYDNLSSWTIYNTSNSGISNDGVYAITLDQLGKRWIGTWGGGVSVFEGGGNWTVYNTSNSGLPHNFVNVITIDPVGINWIGTLGGGLAIFDGASWTTFNVSNSGLPGDFIWCIAVSPSGNKWIGTSSGLAEYDGTNWTTYNSSNSGIPHPYNIIRSIDFDSQNNKWIGTQGGGLVKFDGANWTVYNVANSNIPDDDVISIVVDSQDRVWIATDGGGIAYLEIGVFNVYHSDNSGLPHDQVANIFLDAQENYWISTGGNGLSQVAFQNFPSLPGINLESEPTGKYFCDSAIIMADTGLSNYIWSNGGTDSGTTVYSTGTYWVYNQDTNGCVLARDSISLIHDNFIPYDEEICLVTFDSMESKNAVIFNNTPGMGTDYFKIFKYDNALGQFDSIGVVHADSANIFIDYNCDPQQQSYRYAISAINLCTGESSISPGHTTIHLKAQEGLSGEVCLFWTPYVGFSFSSYDVYMGSSIDSLMYFGTTTDTVFNCLNPPPELTFYQVRVNKQDTCKLSPLEYFTDSRSNIEDNDYTGIIGSSSFNQIQIYPNPVTNNLQICNSSQSKYEIIILDLNGKKLENHGPLTSTHEISLNHLSKGIYILKFMQKGQMLGKKRIIKY